MTFDNSDLPDGENINNFKSALLHNEPFKFHFKNFSNSTSSSTNSSIILDDTPPHHDTLSVAESSIDDLDNNISTELQFLYTVIF